jgi:hypothetical protein
VADPDETVEPVWISVLLDWQNIYSCARDAFVLNDSGPIAGNVYPLKLAVHVASGTDPVLERPRKLQDVRIYRGRPDGAKNPGWYRAWQSQTSAWKKAGGDRVIERYRDLRLRDGVWIEKGVDVSLAIDLVSIAHRQEADCVVVVSSDTDLEPALELATELRGEGFVEVAGWDGPGDCAAILSVTGVRQHRLDRGDYERLKDDTDYNLNIRVRRRRGTNSWEDQIGAEGKHRRD